MANLRKTQTYESAGATGFLRRGEPMVWATGAALAMVLLITATLIIVVLVNGLGVFWPAEIAQAQLDDGTTILGELTDREVVPDTEGHRLQFKIGNRDIQSLDFRWVDETAIQSIAYPEEAIALERQEYGNFYGFLRAVNAPNAADGNAWAQLRHWVDAMADARDELEDLDEEIVDLNYTINRLKLRRADDAPPTEREQAAQETLDAVVAKQRARVAELETVTATFETAGGDTRDMPVLGIIRAYKPNAMSIGAKALFYADKLRELFTENPRESNTEGGLFPAIFGTVMLVFLMSILSFPLGVLAGIYLREYAQEGLMVRMVRIAVNNMAGIPSIVYGIFGLGFFVYGIGGAIDQVFYADRLPTPTFGTGGILWASLTLGLLTVPVVIVATEEALGAIPKGVREGSLSLGATKFQTLVRILIPMASPGIMTGFILAMARAAGEVAPLMITGVVKLAPDLPLDDQFPFFHPDRKFMHLGFHIYDMGFQSPNVEAAKPMVFVTTLLLVLIVLMMSSLAIYLRNRMKRRYTVSAI